MSEGTNTPVEVFEWLSYKPEAGRRAFSVPSTSTGETIVVEFSPVTKAITKVLKRNEFFGIPLQVHRADWHRHLDGTTLNALREALG